jgi:hypothetical protein
MIQNIIHQKNQRTYKKASHKAMPLGTCTDLKIRLQVAEKSNIVPIKVFWDIMPYQLVVTDVSGKLAFANFKLQAVQVVSQKTEIFTNTNLNLAHYLLLYLYSRTSNNGHCRGIQILSVIGGVR